MDGDAVVRTVEFYLLRTDGTWEIATVELSGSEIFLDDDECASLARARLEAETEHLSHIECVGPVYWIQPVDSLELDEIEGC